MFFIFPWQVDVPQDRWPVVNWLIIMATIAVFFCQRPDFEEWEQRYWAYIHDPSPQKVEPEVPGITGAFMLDGWRAKGLIGHTWLHAGWITMEEYEKSLWQAWQEWRHGRKDPYAGYYHPLTPLMREAKKLEAAAPSLPPPPAPALPPLPPPSKPVTGRIERHSPEDRLIIVGCACGKCIRATRQYAGKFVTCPHCKAKVRIPEARPGEKFEIDGCIRFRCHCGKGIKVPARYAGRSGRCPRCGSRVRVPRPDAAGESA